MLQELDERLKQIEAALEKERAEIAQHGANFNMLEGAKQEVLHLISKFKEKVEHVVDGTI